MATTTMTQSIDTDHGLLAGGWLARIAGQLVADMQAEGIVDPLGEPLTLVAVLHDLFTIAGAPVPAEIQHHIG